MGFFERLNNGWTIAQTSFGILRRNKKLVIFPILSGLSLMLIVGSFIAGIFYTVDATDTFIENDNRVLDYLLLFGFYVVNYFVIVFFNMALVHCTRLYLAGEEVTVSKGLQFSWSRIGAIFSWALFAATVGTILRFIQENTGTIGKIVTGLIGIVWGVTTFFVVPIIAYENLGPIDAFKKSATLMKEKWGESLAATFSLGLLQFIAILLLAVPCFFIATGINMFLGIALAVAGGFVVFAVFSAAETVFTACVYSNINGSLDDHFNQQLIDELFVKK